MNGIFDVWLLDDNRGMKVEKTSGGMIYDNRTKRIINKTLKLTKENKLLWKSSWIKIYSWNNSFVVIDNDKRKIPAIFSALNDDFYDYIHKFFPNEKISAIPS